MKILQTTFSYIMMIIFAIITYAPTICILLITYVQITNFIISENKRFNDCRHEQISMMIPLKSIDIYNTTKIERQKLVEEINLTCESKLEVKYFK